MILRIESIVTLGRVLLFCVGLAAALAVQCQSMPATAGETVSGKSIVLATATRGRPVALVIGFSKEGGDGCGAWTNALRGDPALSGVAVYQVASLERVPGFLRGMIKSAMRKGVAPADQDYFVVLSQDDKLWRSYFEVTTDKEPYAVLLDASGKVLWHGHGAAQYLEPLVRAAKP